MAYDDILERIGEFGRYQKQTFALVCAVLIWEGAMSSLYIYVTYPLPHQCLLSEDILNSSVIGQYTFAQNVSLGEDGDNITASTCHIITNQTRRKCQSWVYDTTYFKETAISQFDLVCDQKTWKANLRMIWSIGILIGSVFFGWLSDKFGRKKAILFAIGCHLVTKCLLVVSPNVACLAVFLGLSTGSAVGVYIIAFQLSVESVGVSKRFHIASIAYYVWAGGFSVAAFITYLLPHWKHCTLAIACPGILFVALGWWLPESPRWLLSKGRTDAAIKIINSMAKVNGYPLNSSDDYEFGSCKVLDKRRSNRHLLDLWKDPKLVTRNLVMMLNWIATIMVYYGVTFNIADFSTLPQLNMFLKSLAECAGVFLCHCIVNKIGRKKMFIISMGTTGLACISILFPQLYLHNDYGWVTIMIALFGIVTVAAAFSDLYLFTTELLPTLARTRGLAMFSMTGRIGSIISPYIADIHNLLKNDIGLALPFVIFGSVALLSSVASLVLPETLNKKLPETTDDCLNLGRIQKKTSGKRPEKEEENLVEFISTNAI